MGLALSLAASFGIYAWLLYAVLKLPFSWFIFIMSVTASVEVVIGILGYRAWLSRTRAQTDRSKVHPWTLGAAAALAGALTWCAAYLVWVGFVFAGVTLAVLTAAGFAYAWRPLSQFTSRMPQRSTEYSLPSPFESLRVVMIGFGTLVPFAIGVMFLLEGVTVIGLGLLALGATVLPAAIRRIRRELHSID
jgi:hypothetical protein